MNATIEIVKKTPHPCLRRQQDKWLAKVNGEWITDMPRGPWIKEFNSPESAEKYARIYARLNYPEQQSRP